MRLALEIIFGVALVVISAPFAFSLFSRRGEKRPDRPGERTVVTFRGAESLITKDERESEKDAGFAGYGEGVAREIAERLRERGLAVDEPGADDFGWGLHATLEKERAYILVGRMENDELVEWLLQIVDPSSGGPGPASFVPHVDAAIRAIGADEIIWQRR